MRRRLNLLPGTGVRTRRKFSFKRFLFWLLLIALILGFIFAWKGNELIKGLITWGALTEEKAGGLATFWINLRDTWPFSFVKEGITVDKTVSYMEGVRSNLPRLLGPLNGLVTNASVLTAAVLVIIGIRIYKFFKSGGTPGSFFGSLRHLTITGIFRWFDIAIVIALFYKLASLEKGEAMNIFIKLLPAFVTGLLVYMLLAVIIKKISSYQNKDSLLKTIVIGLTILVVAMTVGILTPIELKGTIGNLIDEAKNTALVFYNGLDKNSQYVLLLVLATIVMAIFSNFILPNRNGNLNVALMEEES